ncbi:MAG TPA: hypothetical protein VFE42_13635 [Chloroflexota bacterium]|nr:hypothetical protein [Chloroflexota bacterium]
MTTQAASPDIASPFAPDEWQRLQTMRMRYQQDHDLFSPREMERLRFMRWLHHSGRLASSADAAGGVNSGNVGASF